MKNYEKPSIIVAEQLAEIVYLADSGTQYSLSDTVKGGGETESNNLFDNAVDAASGAAIIAGSDPEPSDGADTGETGDAVDTGDAPAAETEVTAESEAGTETETAAETEGEAGLSESGEMQGSRLVTCDSKYMNGVWQGAKEGAWGGIHLGAKDVFGCKGCPADKGDGCGLQDANADSRYWRSVGTLMPSWEASGKLPTDSPYGI